MELFGKWQTRKRASNSHANSCSKRKCITFIMKHMYWHILAIIQMWQSWWTFMRTRIVCTWSWSCAKEEPCWIIFTEVITFLNKIWLPSVSRSRLLYCCSRSEAWFMQTWNWKTLCWSHPLSSQSKWQILGSPTFAKKVQLSIYLSIYLLPTPPCICKLRHCTQSFAESLESSKCVLHRFSATPLVCRMIVCHCDI